MHKLLQSSGLKKKVQFKQDRKYLRPLIGFATSRKATDSKANIALEYQYKNGKTQLIAKKTDGKQRSLSEF